jgi:hypothetical protein
VFAAVTNDAKLQIWDLSVSSIDPVVTVDTNLDEDVVKQEAVEDEEEDEDDDDGPGGLMYGSSSQKEPALMHSASQQSMVSSTSAPAQAQAKRLGGRSSMLAGSLSAKEQAQAQTPVAKLLRTLNAQASRRALTTLLFGERSPTIVVGDNRGVVTVYRVLDPATITHEGPVQQTQRLKGAVRAQSDPSSAARLASLEGSATEADDESVSPVGVSSQGSVSGSVGGSVAGKGSGLRQDSETASISAANGGGNDPGTASNLNTNDDTDFAFQQSVEAEGEAEAEAEATEEIDILAEAQWMSGSGSGVEWCRYNVIVYILYYKVIYVYVFGFVKWETCKYLSLQITR